MDFYSWAHPAAASALSAFTTARKPAACLNYLWASGPYEFCAVDMSVGEPEGLSVGVPSVFNYDEGEFGGCEDM